MAILRYDHIDLLRAGTKVVAGNPCRVLRKITEDDRRKGFHNEEIDDEAWNMIWASDRKF